MGFNFQSHPQAAKRPDGAEMSTELWRTVSIRLFASRAIFANSNFSRLLIAEDCDEIWLTFSSWTKSYAMHTVHPLTIFPYPCLFEARHR